MGRKGRKRRNGEREGSAVGDERKGRWEDEEIKGIVLTSDMILNLLTSRCWI